MKKLLIFLILTLKIFSEDRINMYLSFNSKHVLVKNHDYALNEDNQAITFEIQKNKTVYSLTKFDNSFFNDSTAISVGHIYDSNKKGFYAVLRGSLVKGYHKTEYIQSKTVDSKKWIFDNALVFYEDYSLNLVPSIGYNFNKDLGIEFMLLGNCIVSNIKLSH